MSKELSIDLGTTGLTVTANVYLLGVVKATGIACAEIGVTGKYSGDFTATPNDAGVYQVAFFNGAATVSSGGGQIVWDGAAEVLQTGDNYARLGTPAGASVSADIAAIEAQTDDIGAAGAGLSAVPWNAAWDAEVQSEATDALNAYDPPTNAEMEARTLVSAGYASPTNITAGTITTVTNLTNAPTAGDLTATMKTSVNAEADTALADVGVTLARMGALTDWIDGGRLDLILDARASQTGVDDLPTNAELATALGTADDAVLAQVALVKAKTDNLPSDPADASVVAGLIDAVDNFIDTEIADIQARLPAALTAGGNMKSDALAISGSTAAADNLEESAEAIGYGTCGASSTTTAVIASSITPATAVNDQLNGRVLIFKADTTTTALRGQATTISDFVHATQTLTVVVLTTAPVSGDTFVIL